MLGKLTHGLCLSHGRGPRIPNLSYRAVPISRLVKDIPCDRIIDVVLLRAMARRKLDTMPVFFRTSVLGAGIEISDASSINPHRRGRLLRVTTPLGAIR